MYFLDYVSLNNTDTSGIINTFAIIYIAKVIAKYIFPLIAFIIISANYKRIKSLQRDMNFLKGELIDFIDNQESKSNQENKIIGS